MHHQIDVLTKELDRKVTSFESLRKQTESDKAKSEERIEQLKQ
jgi:hypothetical protein